MERRVGREMGPRLGYGVGILTDSLAGAGVCGGRRRGAAMGRAAHYLADRFAGTGGARVLRTAAITALA